MIDKDLFSAFDFGGDSRDEYEEFAYTLLALHNRQRKNELKLDPNLTKAAQAHSDWMAKTGKFDHKGENGSSVSKRAALAGYPSAFVGENILYMWNQEGEAIAFNSWWNSSGHRNNILNASYKSVGFGKSKSQNGTCYYVAVFGNI